MMIGASLLAGTANVIMQLAHPAVGYGVVESTVESGQIFRHPIKRTRTTLSYLVVATLGTDRERQLYRREVNRSHAPVRSGASSPVSYNAFDHDLQLWVAACLYKGVEDVHRYFGPSLTDSQATALYRYGARLGTTLQMPEELWPADRAAFDEYWNESLDRISIDDTVRQYLYDLAVLGFAPRIVRWTLGPFNRFVTTGFLPPRFREEMRLPWSDRQQRRFDRLMSVLGAVVRRLPAPLRRFPFNLVWWDVRRRIRTGRPLV
ncbi:DUF2236 domain-containing protein [Halostreptopolyspora alba]|uniref:DUF2236 domain-containing protein n=2 Tax=Halostreptopolyspora alba TaxID=2487137 RepID=A0A3N0E346_9ACTN|nr:DUF2236 domain-containing protein [Nocardiopsaceae bacterium YIM 96095]